MFFFFTERTSLNITPRLSLLFNSLFLERNSDRAPPKASLAFRSHPSRTHTLQIPASPTSRETSGLSWRERRLPEAGKETGPRPLAWSGNPAEWEHPVAARGGDSAPACHCHLAWVPVLLPVPFTAPCPPRAAARPGVPAVPGSCSRRRTPIPLVSAWNASGPGRAFLLSIAALYIECRDSYSRGSNCFPLLSPPHWWLQTRIWERGALPPVSSAA